MATWIWYIIQLIIALIKWLCSSDSDDEGENSESAWEGVTQAGSAIVDWLQDDEVPIATRLAALYGTSYLVAPEFTEDVVDRVGDAAASFTTSALDTAGRVGGAIVDWIKDNPIVALGIGFGLYWFFFGRNKEDREVVVLPPAPVPESNQRRIQSMREGLNYA